MFGLLLLTCLAPPPAEAPAADAQRYADSLFFHARTIANRYGRPVNRAELLVAAVSALYESAGLPVPPALLAEFEPADDVTLTNLLRKHRQRVGQREHLANNRDLIVSLKGLATELDPFSGVFPREAARRLTEPEFGPGLTLAEAAAPPRTPLALLRRREREPLPDGQPPPAGQPWLVAEVAPGGPAQRAGVRPGDVITHLDGLDVAGPGAPALFGRLFAADFEGELAALKLTLRRNGATKHVALTPAEYSPETVFGMRRQPGNGWDFWLDRSEKLGYIALGYLDGNSPEELDTALARLAEQGLRGLVLDLRGCTGGFMTSLTAVAGRFTRGELGTIRYRDRLAEKQITNVPVLGRQWSGPLVVLIGAETRGGGELLAASLQDQKMRAVRVIGQRTVGKGSVQSGEGGAPIELGDNLVFRYASGFLYRANGDPLEKPRGASRRERWGVQPDPGLDVPLTPDLAKQLQSWYRDAQLRPGDATEALPLDDPTIDPVRALGRRELLGQIGAAKH